MDAIPIFLISLGTAYLASRLAQRGPFTRADLATGLFGGLVSLGMAQVLRTEAVEWGPGLPLILACVLTLGLGSLQRRSFLR